jgi:hypothetical protein
MRFSFMTSTIEAMFTTSNPNSEKNISEIWSGRSIGATPPKQLQDLLTKCHPNSML